MHVREHVFRRGNCAGRLGTLKILEKMPKSINAISDKFRSIFGFYYDGFRNMTWGRPLWVLIILKMVFLFLILRLFFFKPVLSGKTESEKSTFVANELIRGRPGLDDFIVLEGYDVER